MKRKDASKKAIMIRKKIKHTLLVHNLKRIPIIIGLILTRVPKRLAKARGCAAAMRSESAVHLSFFFSCQYGYEIIRYLVEMNFNNFRYLG